MTRETLLDSLKQLLFRRGYTYQDFSDRNSSFDLIARRHETVFVLKVLSNIDSLRSEHARDLQKISHAFAARSLIIGEKSKVFELQASVLYERYELPVLSLEGFSRLLESKLPMQRSFKGQNVVELDTELLRKQREAHALTLKDLSQRAGISLESLHRYEHGQPAQVEVADKLEQLLNVQLKRGIDVFKPLAERTKEDNEPISNSVLEKLQDLGLNLSVFARAPVNAATKEHELLVSHATTKQQLIKKTLSLEKTQAIVHYPGVIITSEHAPDSKEENPVLHESELSTFSSAHDMIKHIQDKKKKKNDS